MHAPHVREAAPAQHRATHLIEVPVGGISSAGAKYALQECEDRMRACTKAGAHMSSCRACGAWAGTLTGWIQTSQQTRAQAGVLTQKLGGKPTCLKLGHTFL